MAGVEITISGMLYDKLNRTTQNVVLIGEATLTGLGVGGGPIIPPGGGGGEGGNPPGIWGGANEPFPTPPIYLPPQLPPGVQPPTPPKPGDPTTPVPPPAGAAGWPVQPVVPPPYVVINYPGVGPVYVAPPAPAKK